MSNIDKRALREAADKATPGKWERGDGNGNGGELHVYCDDVLGSAVCEMTSEYNAIPKYQRINNLNFIAAANPATVLALLDELEAKDRRNAELNSMLERWAVDRAQSASELDDAEKRITEQRETLLAARSHVMQCARLGDAHANGVLQAIDRAAAGKGEAS